MRDEAAIRADLERLRTLDYREYGVFAHQSTLQANLSSDVPDLLAALSAAVARADEADKHAAAVRADMDKLRRRYKVRFDEVHGNRRRAEAAEAELVRLRAQLELLENDVAEGVEIAGEMRAEASRLRARLAWLVRLKDGPRDATYEAEKPLAWAAAREALGVGEAHPDQPDEKLPCGCPNKPLTFFQHCIGTLASSDLADAILERLNGASGLFLVDPSDPDTIQRAAEAARRFAVHKLGWAVNGSDIERLAAAVLASLRDTSDGDVSGPVTDQSSVTRQDQENPK